jgi:threonylcarbamoyladenosine tRNA methylthiotransferase MtaB
MLKVSFHTFGCKNNLADTSRIVLELQGFNGAEILESALNADVHVVNTCTVTASSDAQARNLLRRINRHNKGSLIIVTGCSVRRDSDDYKKLKTEIKQAGNVLEVCDNIGDDICRVIKKRCSLTKNEVLEIRPQLFRTRVFLQVHDGCDHFCSYCIVPFVRGEPKSRKIEDIIAEAKALESYGIKEAVITGINIGDYDAGIEHLIEELLKATKTIRLRLSSLRPSRITPGLIELMNEKRLCPHFHISLQSASDKVLNLMNRHDYTAKDFLSICELVNKRIGDRAPFMAADVIVGHPGEEETDFLESLKVLEQSSLNKLHVFPFSPRPGTAAFIMKRPDQSETQKRRDMLLEFSEKRYLSSLKGMQGKTVEVLWETDKYGHSENYYPVKGTGEPNTIESLKIKGADLKEQVLFT